MHHPSKEDLFDFHAQILPHAKTEEVSHHLSACTDCQIELKAWNFIEHSFEEKALPQPSQKTLDAIHLHAARSIAPQKPSWFTSFVKQFRTGFAVTGIAGLALFCFVMLQKPLDSMKIKAGDSAYGFDQVPTRSSTPSNAPRQAPIQATFRAALPHAESSLEKLDEAIHLDTRGLHLEAQALFQELFSKENNLAQKDKILYHWAVCLNRNNQSGEALEKIKTLERNDPAYPGLLELKATVKE